MKYFFTSLVLILFFSGCSHQNAFSKFKMDEKQELSASSLQSSKIKSGEDIRGIFSAIYLNEVYPESFNQKEYFFVYLYLKEKKIMHNPNALNDAELTLKLNGRPPIKIKQLPHANRFSHLAFTQSEWNSYYLVAFEEEGKELSLVLESGDSLSDALLYKKDEQ
ncbi:hypothetical protein KJ877_04660 [bacterium]|nr:hypothetical protein [bacterium]MBU1990368.1 hypothetical protein [bacterium]